MKGVISICSADANTIKTTVPMTCFLENLTHDKTVFMSLSSQLFLDTAKHCAKSNKVNAGLNEIDTYKNTHCYSHELWLEE